MKNKDFKFILFSFLGWRVALFIFLFLGAFIFSLQGNFLGGGLGNYIKAPWFWAWGNFDGEHYLSIARVGYGNGEQAFFPLYPLLINILGKVFGGDLSSFNLAGLLISNTAFFAALLGLYKLLKIDFDDKKVKGIILLLLLFPTSFYFGAVYTESLFLALVVWSFYFARQKNWLPSSLLGMFASATRVIGIILLPIFLIEAIMEKKFKKEHLWLLLIPLGLGFYMWYLNDKGGDPLAFIHSLPGFGEQRSATPVILPQVFYRYIFKILPNINYSYFPLTFTTLMEFGISVIFLAASVRAFIKMRLSYALFLFVGYLIPTFSGSFSSLPRYAAVLFPAFIIFFEVFSKIPAWIRTLVFVLLGLILAISTMLFTRGFWVS